MFNFRKIAAVALAAAMTLTTAAPVMAATTSPTKAKKPVTERYAVMNDHVKGTKVRANTRKAGDCTIIKYGTSKKTVSIPKYVVRYKVKNVKYKVTTIGKIGKEMSKTKTLTLPTSVKKICDHAFTGAKSLRTLKIQSTSKSFKVTKGAFKGLKTSKITVKISKKLSKAQYKRIKKALRAAGFKGKFARY